MPEAAYIEIVERTSVDDPKVIIPNEVRINGTPLLVPAGESIRIHEVEIPGHGDVVMVTMTLFARRVEIKSEKVAS